MALQMLRRAQEDLRAATNTLATGLTGAEEMTWGSHDVYTGGLRMGDEHHRYRWKRRRTLHTPGETGAGDPQRLAPVREAGETSEHREPTDPGRATQCGEDPLPAPIMGAPLRTPRKPQPPPCHGRRVHPRERPLPPHPTPRQVGHGRSLRGSKTATISCSCGRAQQRREGRALNKSGDARTKPLRKLAGRLLGWREGSRQNCASWRHASP
jgi:hypothetical protein